MTEFKLSKRSQEYFKKLGKEVDYNQILTKSEIDYLKFDFQNTIDTFLEMKVKEKNLAVCQLIIAELMKKLRNSSINNHKLKNKNKNLHKQIRKLENLRGEK